MLGPPTPITTVRMVGEACLALTCRDVASVLGVAERKFGKRFPTSC
jgi:hypothetical protein